MSYRTILNSPTQHPDMTVSQNDMARPLPVDEIHQLLNQCISSDWIYRVRESFSRRIECLKSLSRACHRDWMNIHLQLWARLLYAWCYDMQQLENIEMTRIWMPSSVDSQQMISIHNFFLNKFVNRGLPWQEQCNVTLNNAAVQKLRQMGSIIYMRYIPAVQW